MRALVGAVATWLAGLDPNNVVPAIVGFVAAYVLFEIQEWRRVRLARRQLRRALIQELEHAEMILNTIITKYPDTVQTHEEADRYAAEVRWFHVVGSARARAVGLTRGLPDMPPEAPAGWDQLTSEQIVAHFRTVMPRETIGTKVILPVVESVLAGRTAGFNDSEIAMLSTVRWHAFLLEQESDRMLEFFRMSFTVSGPGNHDIVEQNHERRRGSYVYRAATLVSVVRECVPLLRSGLRTGPAYLKPLQPVFAGAGFIARLAVPLVMLLIMSLIAVTVAATVVLGVLDWLFDGPFTAAREWVKTWVAWLYDL